MRLNRVARLVQEYVLVFQIIKPKICGFFLLAMEILSNLLQRPKFLSFSRQVEERIHICLCQC